MGHADPASVGLADPKAGRRLKQGWDSGKGSGFEAPWPHRTRETCGAPRLAIRFSRAEFGRGVVAEFDAEGIVHQAIQNAIGDCGVADFFVLLLEPVLSNHGLAVAKLRPLTW